MPAWLASILAPLLEKIGATILGDIVTWLKGIVASNEQKQVDNKDATAEQSAAASGELNAIEKTETDVLNGTTPAP